jgi:hypothetical protein
MTNGGLRGNPNIAALPAIARLCACESARGPDADRHVKLLIQFAVEGSLSGVYSHAIDQQTSTVGGKRPRRRGFLRDLKVVVLKQTSKRQRLRLVRAGARSRWP